METHETKQDPVEMLRRYLIRGKDDIHIYRDKCTTFVDFRIRLCSWLGST